MDLARTSINWKL